tara:strand:+ start:7691 stop:8065 length:375 start_codon:yes stop_codon:yes gene_type:complete
VIKLAFIDTFLADKQRRKIVVTGALVGGAALVAGFGRAIDKKIPGYKRTTDTSYLFMRGALIGGLLTIPAAGYIANKGVNMNVFGNAQRPMWHDSTPKTPEGHMAFKNDIDGTTYFLPTPPKTN